MRFNLVFGGVTLLPWELELLDALRQEIDHGKSIIGVYLELTKAFDTVNHKILLHKLEHYGVRGHVQAPNPRILEPDWLESFKTRQSYSLAKSACSE